MPVEIIMPKLGLTMTEGQIVEWKIKEGESIRKGDILFVLETEKVTYDVESPGDGILAKILIQEGKSVPVGTVVGYLARPGEDVSGLSPAGLPAAGQASSDRETPPCPPETQEVVPPGSEEGPQGRIKASPLAKKTAAANYVDLRTVKGTGSGGRILRSDVEAELGRKKSGADIPAMPAATDEDRLVPFSGMRRAIAKKMLASKVETAQTYMSVTVDAGNVMEYREALLPLIEEQYGVRATITDLMMKITASAIRMHPIINTRWTDKGLLYLKDVHMGMAMALNEGLIVPVIRNIHDKGLGQIARDRSDLIRKGKENRFLPDDISGSTFTLSAMGMYGIEQFTSNINLPENAILAVGAIIDKPVAQNGAVVIRPVMTITLSYDHRAIDGAEAGKFMRTLKSFIEKPIRILA
ncbi:dihydrolipoamide acetyltransferase family protein [Desulfatirhabdium butyrativorans]|uniref:dihydrolipoamide acetyltransferase family protein n=1 Tax=Desulfatirhabdium butyrativorans TaxID=340467 RepID=UPI0003F58A47|nr:dihydrolipoamide acetyltransferase family protein [Desulfatirhabdium butyrativorans]